jgi:hypothetical protein
MNTIRNHCAASESNLAEMLLDPESAPTKVRAHVEQCEHCRAELAELRATMDLLDTWDSPEPSPYFLTRLDARMREERETAPAGWPVSWVAQLRARLAYGPSMHLRPVAVMAMTVLLLIGGGTYLGVTDWDRPSTPGQAAVVHDLQTLDKNAQLLDQLESLSTTGEQGD